MCYAYITFLNNMWVLITSFKLFFFYSKVLNKINITFSIFSPISLSLFPRTGEKNTQSQFAADKKISLHKQFSLSGWMCLILIPFRALMPRGVGMMWRSTASFWVTNCTFCVNGKIFIPNHCYPDFCPILIQAIIIIERIASFPSIIFTILSAVFADIGARGLTLTCELTSDSF